MKIRVYIGIVGSGKDTRARKECDTTMAFADGVRQLLWEVLGWSPNSEEEYRDFKDAKIYLPSQRLAYVHGRELLQNLGEAMKRELMPSIWSRKLIARLFKLSRIVPKNYTVGVTDCRFVNEVVDLLEFCSAEGIPLEFVFTNYKSENYAILAHKSEELAKSCLADNVDNRFEDSEVFTEYIKNRFGYGKLS